MNHVTLVHAQVLARRYFDHDVVPRLVGLPPGAVARLRRRYVADVVHALTEAFAGSSRPAYARLHAPAWAASGGRPSALLREHRGHRRGAVDRPARRRP